MQHKKNKTYIFSLALASEIHLDPQGYFNKNKSYFTLWGGQDTCDKGEALWLSPLLDTVWQVYTFQFTPKNADYDYLLFRCDTIINDRGIIFIDSLSDIYPYNAHDISVSIKDTTVLRTNRCVNLSSTTGITTYDSLYWYSIPAGFHSDQQNPGVVCPDSTTYYIVAMHDTTMTCAGTWWSYDTVKVTVVDSFTTVKEISQENYPVFKIRPNPISKQGSIIISTSEEGTALFYNLLGELLFSTVLHVGDNTINCSEFNCGSNFLICQAKFNQRTETKRLIIMK